MFYEPSFWFSVNNFVLLKCTAHTFKYEREREREVDCVLLDIGMSLRPQGIRCNCFMHAWMAATEFQTFS